MDDLRENNALFELIYEEDKAIEGDIDKCREFLGNKEGFKLFHMNVRSIRNKHTELKVLMKQIGGQDLDCIILSEAHLNSNMNVNQFDLGIGFKIYATINNKRKTDGLVIYIKDSLEHSVKEIKLTDSNCMRVNVTKFNKTFTCHAFYRSPNGKVDDFLSELPDILNTTTTNNNYINIITGDFNIDILDTRSSKVQRYLNILAEKGYMSLLNKPTHINKKSQTCLDHIFAGPQISDKFTSFILHNATSDHYPVLLNIKKTVTRTKENSNHYFTSRKIQYENVISDLKTEKWENIYQCQYPNECLEMFTKRIKTTVEKNTFTKIKKVVKIMRPWITEGLINSMKKRDKLHSLIRKQPFNKKLIDTYKRYRNKLNSLMSAVRTEYLKREIEETKGDRRKIWGIINEETKYKNKTKKDIEQIEIEGSLVKVHDNSLQVANYFNEYFAKIGTDSMFNRATNIEILDNHRDRTVNSSFYMKKIVPAELEQIISKLKERSAPGWDDLDSALIKKIGPFITKPLCYIFNLCIKKGIFPEQFKMSVVCPVYKKNNHDHVENYRPISLLTTFSKILEKCVKKRLVNFLEENDILNPSQYGFRKQMSTSDAILEVVEGVYPILDNGEKAAACMMDLSLAFNTVVHSTLLNTMYKLGIRENSLNFFRSYLEGRSQRVKLRAKSTIDENPNKKSNKKNTTSQTIISDVVRNKPFSVPQGTVLSPVLYNIYVVDLYKLPITGKLVSFADDTALIERGDSWQEVFSRMQSDLRIIKCWFQANNLRLNMDKTKILPFAITKPQLPSYKKVTIHDSPDCQEPCHCSALEIVEQIRYLGIEMDCFLRWDKHIDALTKRLRRYIYPFLTLKTFLPLNLLKEVYHALAQSALEYGITAYGRADKTKKQRLETVQNTLLKIIYKKEKKYPTKELYKNLGILKLDHLHTRNLCTYIHKNKNIYIKEKICDYKLRGEKINIERYKTTKGQKSIKFCGIKLYSKLPKTIKNQENSEKFKLELKSWLKELQTNQ